MVQEEARLLKEQQLIEDCTDLLLDKLNSLLASSEALHGSWFHEGERPSRFLWQLHQDRIQERAREEAARREEEPLNHSPGQT